MKHLESGRSFVEMLGVLAVMGIISIGGLYGYTYAMKRHRANELLNEANKRAVMVATQLMTGKDPKDVNIDEFPTNTPYGTFPTKITPVEDDKFKMTVSGLDEDTCQYMEELAGGPLRRVSCKGTEGSFTAEMFFNNDLSTEERASDFTTSETCKSPYKWCSGSKICTSEETCTCSGITPACKICDTTTGEYSIDEDDDTPCKTDPALTEENGTCQLGECVAETICSSNVGDPCNDNSTVCPGYYCSIAGGEVIDLGEQGDYCDDDYYVPGSGSIQPLGTPKKVKTSYLSSPDTVASWDAAVNYCEALKKAIHDNVVVNNVDYSEYNELSVGLAPVPNGCSYSMPNVTEKACQEVAGLNNYWLNQPCQFDCKTTGTESCPLTNDPKAMNSYLVNGGVNNLSYIYGAEKYNSGYALCK